MTAILAIYEATVFRVIRLWDEHFEGSMTARPEDVPKGIGGLLSSCCCEWWQLATTCERDTTIHRHRNRETSDRESLVVCFIF